MEKKAADFFCKGDVGTPDFVDNGFNGCYAVSALHAMAGSPVLINGLWKNEARETSLAGKFVRQLIKWRGIFLSKWMEKMATREVNRKRLRSETPQVISAELSQHLNVGALHLSFIILQRSEMHPSIYRGGTGSGWCRLRQASSGNNSCTFNGTAVAWSPWHPMQHPKRHSNSRHRVYRQSRGHVFFRSTSADSVA